MKGKKVFNVNWKSLKVLPLAALLALPLNSFADDIDKGTDGNDKKPERVELNYKQRHSRLAQNSNLYADGIKIKRDLSILKEVQEQRILAEDEIPAEELYGGIWVNNRVNAYTTITDAPDTFKVDLSNFTMPTMGHITSLFGKRRRRMHYGMDLKVQVGDTIYAAFDGKIRMTEFERRGYGYYVVIRHTNGLETVYGHLSKFLVKDNDVVRSGDPIALGGNTGRSSGAHLHFEIRYMGKAMDPRNIVDFDNKVCHRDEYVITPESFNTPGSRWAPNAIATASGVIKTANKYTSGEYAYHRIKSGDTLGGLASKYGTSVRELCRLNNITSKSILRAGRTLKVPQ